MDADLTVDDELQPSEPDAGVRDLGEGESLVGGSHVHHELDRHIGHGVELGLLDDEVEDPFIDVAGVALGAGDGHLAAVGQLTSRGAGADDRWNTELSRDDGGMAGPATPVGDDG